MPFTDAKRLPSLQHTPTPWKGAEVTFGSSVGGQDEESGPAMLIWPAHQNSLQANLAGTIIGEFYDVGDPDDGGQDAHVNAAFVVKAVNHHDEMLAALQSVVAVLEAGGLTALAGAGASPVHTETLRDLVKRVEAR